MRVAYRSVSAYLAAGQLQGSLPHRKCQRAQTARTTIEQHHSDLRNPRIRIERFTHHELLAQLLKLLPIQIHRLDLVDGIQIPSIGRLQREVNSTETVCRASCSSKTRSAGSIGGDERETLIKEAL